MAEFRFIHAADLHLGGDLGGLAVRSPKVGALIRRAPEAALDNLVDLTLRENAALLLLAGDVFDGAWRDLRAGFAFAEACARLDRAGVRVVAIKGNHDADSVVVDSLPWPKNVEVLPSDRPTTIDAPEIGAAVTGQSFAARETSENLAAGYPPPRGGRFEFALLHTSADGRPGHAPYAPCSPDALARAGYDYWALGHVHAKETLRERPWIVYSGCLQGRTWREAGPKGAMVGRVVDGVLAELRFEACDAARWALVEVAMDGVGDDAEAAERLRAGLADVRRDADGRPVAARVVYRGATALDADLRRLGDARLQADAEAVALQLGDDVLIEAARVATSPATEGLAADARLEQDLRRALDAALADPVAREALADDAARLADRAGPAAAALDLDAAALDALAEEARALALAAARVGGTAP